MAASDPFFPIVYTIRAVKPETAAANLFAHSTRASESVRGAGPQVSGAILMYHRVAVEKADAHRLCVSPERFRQHMQWLHDRQCDVVPLAELATSPSAGRPRLAITFDDGYLDVLTSAVPILAEFGYPATVFIVGTALDGGREFWWDAIGRALSAETPLPTMLTLGSIPGFTNVPTSTAFDRSAAVDQLNQTFYRLSQPLRAAALEELLSWSAAGPSKAESRPMTADEVRNLSKMPNMTIGAHTESHVWLPAQAKEVCRQEMTASKRRLERLLGVPWRLSRTPMALSTPRQWR